MTKVSSFVSIASCLLLLQGCDRAPESASEPAANAPAGEHGYFTVDLTPGDYAFIAEVPDPQDAGFILPFSVNASD